MLDIDKILRNEETLDPEDWDKMRHLGHKMMDDMFDYFQSLRNRPVWKSPDEVMKAALNKPVPAQPEDIDKTYSDFLTTVLPFNKGNVHPRFWAWVEGNGTPFGMLADMLASGLNPNLGVANTSAVYVEYQVINWMKEILGFDPDASGLLVSGGSVANLVGIAVARNSLAEFKIRENGLTGVSGKLTIYCSTETHSSVQKAVELLGIGSNALRKIPVNKDFQISIDTLKEKISEDKKSGFIPFCIVGNAGTVNTGAIDPLNELADICAEENLWLHVDGAFGAFTYLVDELKFMVKGMERADSLAFDLHKWMYMPYESGCTLIRNQEKHKNAFVLTPEYLIKFEEGLAAGPEPLSNYGIQLSRGFRALKVWMSLKEHGINKYKKLIRQNIAQAQYLERLISGKTELEILAPVPLNIVCYRFVQPGISNEALDKLNKDILIQLQLRGIAAPSHTIINGKFALRAANVNHRSRKEDFETLVNETVKIGYELLKR
ncbi:MAG: aminotransferase class I/II-fold pyridoxal phosphate-dependent enzyme [Ignavibacteriaceae bacterium]